MLIHGYGEDFLTLWLVTEKIDEIVHDGTIHKEAVVFYRPSFGRRGKGDARASSQFGEFDAIVITSRTAYLIESKWDGALRNAEKAKKVVLAGHQVERHRIMEWYIRNWKPEYWENPPQSKVDEFEKRFKNSSIAPKGSRLRQNLETVLGKIGSGKDVKHLLVYFSKSGTPNIETDYDVVFEKLVVDYKPDLDNYVTLSFSEEG